MDKFRFSSKKIGRIILKTFLYSMLSLAVTFIFYRPKFTWDYISECIFPIIYGGYGYVTAFVAFYFIAPFLKRILSAMDRQAHKKLLSVGGVILFLIPMIFLGSHSNVKDLFWIFMAISFVLFYVKKYRVRWAIDRKLQVRVCVVNLAIIVCFAFGCLFLKKYIPWLGEYSSEWARYYSPFMMAAVASLFLIFSALDVKESKAANWIADRTFGVYLLHEAPAIRGYFWVRTFHVNGWGTNKMLPFMMVGLCLMIYAVCVLVDGAITFVIRKSGKGIHSEKLEFVCERIDTWMNSLELEE